jgi:predicted ArsR family transcriptional regulator
MKSIRQRILDLLESRRAASAQELAQALQVTAANIRHHLANLAAEGLVAKTGSRQPTGRGRPTGVFGLVVRQDNHQALNEVLLELLASRYADDDSWLCAAGRGLAGHAGNPERHITQRLVSAMQRLEALHYSPRWEAHPGAPQVVFERCPYGEIIENHPELCHMDRYLLQSLTAEDCEQTEKLTPTPLGTRVCRFKVG